MRAPTGPVSIAADSLRSQFRLLGLFAWRLLRGKFRCLWMSTGQLDGIVRVLVGWIWIVRTFVGRFVLALDEEAVVSIHPAGQFGDGHLRGMIFARAR